MIIFLSLIPLLAIISGLFLYRHDGKREILRFDVVQFVYGFIIAPIMFIWIKSFFFFVIVREAQPIISQTDAFLADTVLSTLLLIIYAFIVIHTLTTSFNRKVVKDPLHDLFEHAEYFHMWISHLPIFVGYLSLFALFAIGNIFFPLDIIISQWQLYGLSLLALFLGTTQFMAVWITNLEMRNFLRVMKLVFALFFILHAGAYFVFVPKFSGQMVVFWVSFGAITTSVLYALFAVRFEVVRNFFNKFKHERDFSKISDE